MPAAPTTSARQRRRLALADRRLDLLIRQANDPLGGWHHENELAAIEIELQWIEAVDLDDLESRIHAVAVKHCIALREPVVREMVAYLLEGIRP